jgi:hypothetical protein
LDDVRVHDLREVPGAGEVHVGADLAALDLLHGLLEGVEGLILDQQSKRSSNSASVFLQT